MIPDLPKGFSHPMRIGTGAFAAVYRVRQTALDRWVALKFIHEKNRKKRLELLQEARTQAKLRSSCVPEVYDAFEWRASICMVMEWVRGASLTRVLQCTLSEEERFSIAGALIDTLAEIHRRGVVHRDLKPQNIILSPENGIYFVDFGFSKDIADITQSSNGTTRGTPAYMAPELWSQTGTTDFKRADVFALGKILMQVLDGTSLDRFTIDLVEVHPQKRPASGEVVAEKWHGLSVGAATAIWKKDIEDLSALTLSSQLFTAAQQLLAAHRNDESYWLLVESLEEDPNNHGAVELLGAFQEHTKRRLKPLYYAAAALLLIGGVVGAFLAGMKTAGGVPSSSWNYTRDGRFSSSVNAVDDKRVAAGMASLRQDTLRSNLLRGYLFIRGLHQGVRVVIDGDTLTDAAGAVDGIPLYRGDHDVTLLDSTGRVLRTETVGLLPFQLKTIDGDSHSYRSKELR